MDIERLKKLCRGASEGPWTARNLNYPFGLPMVVLPNKETDEDLWAIDVLTDNDALFVAESRTALPQLIEENERLRGALEHIFYSIDPEIGTLKNIARKALGEGGG